MKSHSLDLYYFTTDIKKHKSKKKELLSLINNAAKNNYYGEVTTDYGLPIQEKKYFNYFIKFIDCYFKSIIKIFNTENIHVSEMWYQIYEKGQQHGWHTHGNAQFTNIYYLDLPYRSMQTQFYDVVNKKSIEINVKEGQIITIPTFICHRSAPNTTNKKKTIISFNSNIELNYASVPNQ